MQIFMQLVSILAMIEFLFSPMGALSSVCWMLWTTQTINLSKCHTIWSFDWPVFHDWEYKHYLRTWQTYFPEFPQLRLNELVLIQINSITAHPTSESKWVAKATILEVCWEAINCNWLPGREYFHNSAWPAALIKINVVLKWKNVEQHPQESKMGINILRIITFKTHLIKVQFHTMLVINVIPTTCNIFNQEWNIGTSISQSSTYTM